MRIDRVKFAAALASKDITAKRLAKLAGLSRATVSSVKTGKSCCEETGAAIARALGVDVTDLTADE